MNTARKPRVTIYDIARLSGASPSTVSAALGDSWQKRRIGEATAMRIRRIAADNGYTANSYARTLRGARSGLIGLILPVHVNRFFSSLSQSFEAEARLRGRCPVIASTLRDSGEEIRTVQTLISYKVEYLFIAGANDPDALSLLCREAKLPHLFIDLPSKDAPSVVSDNYRGAHLLTQKILSTMSHNVPAKRASPFMIGGLSTDYASALRMQAFKDTVTAAGLPFDASHIIESGYAPEHAARDIAALCDRLGGPPAGLFVNSINAFEGVVSHFVDRPPAHFMHCTIGCYDYDPLAAFLQFPVHMVRQNSDELIASAFRLVDAGQQSPLLIQVEPELISPRTVYTAPKKSTTLTVADHDKTAAHR